MSEKKKKRRERVRDFIDANCKSPLLGALYALVFGPFGLIYTRPSNTLIALLLAVGAGMVYWPLVGLVWLGGVVVAPFQVRAYNSRIRRSARYFVV